MSGGAGYVMSRQTLELVAPILKDTSDEGKCASNNHSMEDMQIGNDENYAQIFQLLNFIETLNFLTRNFYSFFRD